MTRTSAKLISFGTALVSAGTAFGAQAAEFCTADKTVVVSTSAGLDAAANSWNSGAWAGHACVHVVLANGTTPITASRTFGRPARASATRLVIRRLESKAVAVVGRVLKVAGPNVTVHGLTLKKGLMIGGDNSRALRNEAWDDNRNKPAMAAILIQRGRNVRVAFNTIHSSTVGIRLDSNSAILSPRIDHNLLTDQHKGGPDKNLHEPIQIGQSTKNQNYSHHAVVEWNYISAPKVEGDDEGISVKTSDNIIRYNTIVNGQRIINNRQGHRNQYIANYISNAPGILIFGADNQVVSNYINPMRVGHHGITVMAGSVSATSTQLGGYPAALRTTVYDNTSTEYAIGDLFSSVRRPVMANGTNFYGNKVLGHVTARLVSCVSGRAYLSCGKQVNTHFASNAKMKATYTPRRLSPAETGAKGQPWRD